MFLSVNQESTCVNELLIDAINSQAIVEYNNGSKYLYSDVEFGALYDLIYRQTDSIGTWVINNLKNGAKTRCVKL